MKYILILLLISANCFAAVEYDLYTRGPSVSWVIVDGKLVKNSLGKTFNTIEDSTAAATAIKIDCPKCKVLIHVEDFEITSTKRNASSSSKLSSSSSASSSKAYISMTMPKQWADGKVLTEAQIQGYSLKIINKSGAIKYYTYPAVKEPILLEITEPISSTDKLSVSTIAFIDNYSEYIDVQR